jgi:signal transduction histidine kinase
MGSELVERVVHPADLPVVEDILRRVAAARDEDVVEGEYRCRHKDGRWIRVHGRFVVFDRAPDGTATQVLGSLEDITEARRAQEELRRHREHLEERVRERTEELEAANARLEAFSYSVSHDLRSPLRTMVNLAEITLDDAGDRLDDDDRENLERIVAAGGRANQLIGALMRLGQITHAPLDVQQVDLGAVARELIQELRREEPARRVEVLVGEGLRAECDPALIRVVLGNLLHNAWKYTRERAPAHIELGVTTAGDGERVFFVRDDGVGFAPEQAAPLFQPFRRLDPDGRYEGMGVGLANAARAVRRHGGRIWATGSPGNGATFWFTLPDPPA